MRRSPVGTGSPGRGAAGVRGATVFLLCGLPGAGKTTLARQLERERPALRLAEDEWVRRLYPAGDADDDARRIAIKDVQWLVALRAVALGIDVVLDWGLWCRAERDDFRMRAAAAGIAAVILYLEVPREELRRRLAARNANLPPDTFRVGAAMLDEYLAVFEPPGDDEPGWRHAATP